MGNEEGYSKSSDDWSTSTTFENACDIFTENRREHNARGNAESSSLSNSAYISLGKSLQELVNFYFILFILTTNGLED